METTKEKEAKFMEDINQNWWNDKLWVILNDACNDPDDSNAIKDLNLLAMRWKNLSEEKREHMNEAFIIICGWSFDSLLAKVDGREDRIRELEADLYIKIPFKRSQAHVHGDDQAWIDKWEKEVEAELERIR